MTDRTELGFLLDHVMRVVFSREQPILERHQLEMWDYVVLAALDRGPASTQSDLSAATGRDKTRLIGNLDRLEKSGLVVRKQDPADRRNRIVSLTSKGRRAVRSCRDDILAMEDELMSSISPRDRAGFERTMNGLVRRFDRQGNPRGTK